MYGYWDSRDTGAGPLPGPTAKVDPLAFLTEVPPGLRDLHLWCMSLDEAALALDRAHDLLSGDERERAARFKVEHARTRYVLARAQLRKVLGTYLAADPAGLVFGYNEYGRPALSGRGGDLTFNVSHTENIGLIAVAFGRDVGVDIEARTRAVDAAELATRFFSDREAGTINALARGERERIFFTVWTQKEAFIKAMGDGLSRSLRSFDVCTTVQPLSTIQTRPDRREGEDFTVVQLDPGNDFAGAAALKGGFDKLYFFDLQTDLDVT